MDPRLCELVQRTIDARDGADEWRLLLTPEGCLLPDKRFDGVSVVGIPSSILQSVLAFKSSPIALITIPLLLYARKTFEERELQVFDKTYLERYFEQLRTIDQMHGEYHVGLANNFKRFIAEVLVCLPSISIEELRALLLDGRLSR